MRKLPGLSDGPEPETSGGSSLASRLASEMILGWQAGQRPLVEDFLSRHPELQERLECALELIAEELALRDEFGASIPLSELVERFPQWESHVRALGECQQAFGNCPSTVRFPSAGEWLGDFNLISKLGQGAHGLVFLATQTSLGERPVVLKLTSSLGLEHLSLARLQHTHIVPLYSVHEFPEHGLRGLCLPYHGGKSLATILAVIAKRQASELSGADLLIALTQQEQSIPLPIAVCGPACDLLSRVSYTEAICRIGICIAEALQFAHDRDLLHLDLKPSNVLIAADATPMLLDFHLARPPLHVGEPAPLWLGGTSGYMAPELADAIAAVRSGEPIRMEVDARADIYSLGVLLAEALGQNSSASGIAMSRGLADIVARCTSINPAERYRRSADVANDLRRHIADLPLQGVPNHSIVERWGKWRRRRPFALSVAALVAALLIAGVGGATQIVDRTERARAALQEGEEHLKSDRLSEAVETLRGGETLLEGVPFCPELTERMRQTRIRAERGVAAKELHSIIERLRPLYPAEVISALQLKEAVSRCRELWEERSAIVGRLAGQATPEQEQEWRADMLDLAVLFSHFEVCFADHKDINSAREHALAILTEAESLLGPSRAVYCEREVQSRALGRRAVAEEMRRKSETVPVKTAWEYLVNARTHLATNDFHLASKEFDICLQKKPGSLWANYYRGVCSLRLGEFSEACSFFTACIALEPGSGWCLYNRGLALLKCGRFLQARNDLDRALAVDPGLTSVYIARSAANSRLGRLTEARSDLNSALKAGFSTATIEFHTASIWLASGDRNSALISLRNCLSHDPFHLEARSLLDSLEKVR
jgi:serine/threonine protein kinase